MQKSEKRELKVRGKTKLESNRCFDNPFVDQVERRNGEVMKNKVIQLVQ